MHPRHDIVPLVHPLLGFGGQEVNPTGLIRLPVRFGDKLKSKNLEVDFLVVDVPTAYNVILGRPTLHKVKAVIAPYLIQLQFDADDGSIGEMRRDQRTARECYLNKEQGKRGGLHIRLSTILITLILRSPGLSIQVISCLIPCTLTFTRRRNKFHLLGVTTFILGPLALIHVVKPASPRPCANTLGYWHGPADSLAPWLKPPFQPLRSLQPWPLQAPPLAGAASLSSQLLGHLNQPSTFPSPSALCRGSHRLSERFGHCHLFLGDPREFEVAEVTKSHDLVKSWISENWAVAYDLMKVVDGCWALRGEPPTAQEAATMGRLGVRPPVDQLPDGRGADRPAPASPAWVGADVAVSSGRPSIRWRLRTSKLMAGFFPRGTRGGAYGQNNLGSQGKEPNKVLKCAFLACWLTRCCLSSSRWCSAPAATCSKVASLVSKTINLALAYSAKTKGKSGQNQTEKMTNIGTTNTLRKILKDQKAHHSKEEVISKKLQLRELIQRFPITRLALPPLRALHRFHRLSHKLGDGPGLIILPYDIFLSLAMGSPKRFLIGLSSFQSGTFPQPDSRWTKRKPYFQCFIFDFFSIAVMNPNLLLKQYHPKSLVSLGALWTVNARAEQVKPCSSQFILVQNLFNHRVKRKSEIVVESRMINSYTFGKRLIHGGIRLGDYEGVRSRQEYRNDLGVKKVAGLTILRVRAGYNP
ncbi:hypothetical protein Cgig2_019156 [Carnegiea gigantea]|uniref:Uncharacterized protein n=1 Tax=Carnegiea gigantea TaxID=171969 RepID=A0A9Q1GNJ6_9CARY|nr:hypothetical protein Cgig2_019156 [Carnegiea gigantea]